MSRERVAVAADTDQGTELPPSLGFDAAWAHPVLGRLLRGQSQRQWLDRRHPWLLDTVVVLIVVAICLPNLLHGGSASPFGETDSRDQWPSGVPFALTAALVFPLWWRRKAPGVVCFVIALVSLVQWALGLWLPAGVSALVALYTLARHGSLRVLGWAGTLAAAEVTLGVWFLVPVDHPMLGAFFLLGAVTAATAVGLTLRIRQMYLAALEDRARRLEIEQEQRMRLTAAAERSRVAREMHDIVGHNLSVMVTVADGGAALATKRGEHTAETLRLLADTGRQAMSELRRVLGVLRDGQHNDKRPLNPQPGIRDLDPLLSRIRASGLRVAYQTVGNLDALGSGVQLTVYRIVQESLTNTLKHAGIGSTAEVTVTADAGKVHIRVADTGVPPNAPARAVPDRLPGDSGHGLIGIRQRAAMYGGTVTIGPRNTGHGWMVDAQLDVPPSSGLSASGELLASGEHLP